MNLDKPASSSGVLTFIRERAPTSTAISDEALLELLSGYPGTVSRWTHPDITDSLRTLEDFRREAENAQKNRFPELAELFLNLTEGAQ